jgi:farnesyl diphosphate synthase
MINLKLDKALKKVTDLVNKRMDELLPDSEEFNESRLVEAMRYSALSDGKRIRPFITIISANIFGVDAKFSLDVAAAIEFIHVYSLIHDDLPAMDDDDYRRGKLSCHKKFTEATAILAGDALLTYAFQILSDPKTNSDPLIRCELINIISKAVGFSGMVGGQMIDLEVDNKIISAEKVARLQRLKTGEMFMAAAEAGAILGKATPKKRTALIRFAHDIGLAFQIKDDILDHQGTKIGKTKIIETKNKKDSASIVDIIGLENSMEQLDLLYEQAKSHLGIFGFKANLLLDLADYIIIRKK